ncbi:thiamine-phosphate kinase [Geofilum sp. OHC36d9]|uniref:thiamine-phosphate kinase n=1 Tax=Geofilum sp. OHC36d9 TaxID=3458413 RepID=UPI00403414AE
MSQNETSLSDLGIYGLTEHVNQMIKTVQPTTIMGNSDDCSVLNHSDLQLLSNSLMLEGIHFDLIYTPLQHLGFKAVVNAITDVIAMNGRATQISVTLGLSNKMTLERTDLLMSGILAACEEYQLDLTGFRPTSSLTGLTIDIAVIGTATENSVVYRSGAKPTDIMYATGDLGAALLGLHLLEREKRVLKDNNYNQPEFGDNEYILRRQLKPQARIQTVKQLEELAIKPTSMIAIKEGLAAASILLCQSSKTGCRIYENKIPLDQKTLKAAGEIDFNPLVAALNGGEDYELLFTVSLQEYEKKQEALKSVGSVIGYITETNKACRLITMADQEIDLKAQGWGKKNK